MIRRAQTDELPLIYDIYLRATVASKLPSGATWGRQQFVEEFEGGECWVRLIKEKISSFIFTRLNSQALEITQLASDPAHWRSGQMTELIRFVMAQHQGEIWLEVHALNRGARHLYEKLGFQQVGLRPRYYLDGGDAVLYSYSKISGSHSKP